MAEIVLNYLTVLVWPVTVILMIFFFRKQQLVILHKITKIKFGDFEVGFDELQKAAKALQKSKEEEQKDDTKKIADGAAEATGAKGASQISSQIAGSSKVTGSLSAKGARPPKEPAHFEIAPYLRQNLTNRTKILESWDAFEYSVRRTAEQAQITEGYMPFFALLKNMETLDLLSDNDIEFFKQMRDLRDRVAAEENVMVTNNQMSSFVNFLSDLTVYLINNIKRTYPNIFTTPQ